MPCFSISCFVILSSGLKGFLIPFVIVKIPVPFTGFPDVYCHGSPEASP